MSVPSGPTRALLLAATAALLLDSACSLTSAGTQLGGGFITGVKTQDSALGKATAVAVDSAMNALTRSLRDSIRPQVDSTVARALVRLTAGIDTAGKRAARSIKPVGDAADSQVARVLGTARESADTTVRLLLKRARRTIDSMAATVPETAAVHFMAGVNTGLNGTLRPTILKLVAEVADSVRSAADREARSPLFRTVGAFLWLLGGIVLAGLIGFCIMAWKGLHRTRTALEVVTGTIKTHGNQDLRDAIKANARSKKVEGWLDDFLNEKGLL